MTAVSIRPDVAAAKDKIRLRKLQDRLLRHEVLLEHVLVRVRELVARGDRAELDRLEELLVTSIAAGPPPLPDGANDTPLDEDIRREAERLRKIVEEIATRGVEMGGSGAALQCREVLGWPLELRLAQPRRSG